MPVFTAAIAAVMAVGAATTVAATVAAVATAAVAVSAAVGVVGLAVTAVGMVTKNQDLLKAGKIMGYVGLAGGIAGGAIGGAGGLMEGGAGFLEGAKGAYVHAQEKLAEAWADPGKVWSGIFNPNAGASVAGAVPGEQEALGSGSVSATNPEAGANLVAANPGMSQDALGRGVVAGTPMPTPDQVAASAAQSVAPVTPATAFAGQPDPFQVAVPSIPTTPTTGTENFLNLRPGATNAPGMFGAPDAHNVIGAYSTATGPAAPSGSFLSNVPDWVKYSGTMAAGQALSGAAAGWYAGASAEQKLEYDRMVNEQRQNQVQYQNRNNQYAPLLSFAK